MPYSTPMVSARWEGVRENREEKDIENIGFFAYF
jgi:hypothetical protein